MLSAHNSLPREGHLEALYHIFSYLKTHENSRLVFDSAYPDIDDRRFHTGDWTDFYPNAVDELPLHMPEPHGFPLISHVLSMPITPETSLQDGHNQESSYSLTRLPSYGIPNVNTVESSTFGSEFIALRIATDLIVSLRYKLRMFGMPLTGPANVFCDNQGVVNNTTLPESILTKKHNQICYHRVREAVAAKIIRIAKEDSSTNLADLLTKPLGLPQRHFLLQRILY